MVIVVDDKIVARHDRLSNAGETRYDWQHQIPLLQRKPGALRNGAPFADMPEPDDAEPAPGHDDEVRSRLDRQPSER